MIGNAHGRPGTSRAGHIWVYTLGVTTQFGREQRE